MRSSECVSQARTQEPPGTSGRPCFSSGLPPGWSEGAVGRVCKDPQGVIPEPRASPKLPWVRPPNKPPDSTSPWLPSLCDGTRGGATGAAFFPQRGSHSARGGPAPASGGSHQALPRGPSEASEARPAPTPRLSDRRWVASHWAAARPVCKGRHSREQRA